jgi:multisubunit Na+/H+ antiporter MnhB subunit
MEGEQALGRVIEFVFNPLYRLAVVCSLIYFLYGVTLFIWQMRNPDGGDTQKRIDGKSHMIWGLVGLFIIFSVGAIIEFFNSTLGGVFVF